MTSQIFEFMKEIMGFVSIFGKSTMKNGWPFAAKFKNIIFSFKDLCLNFHSTSTPYNFIQQLIFIQLQRYIISFNRNIHSTSTPYHFIQHKHSFNFNAILYFHSTQIFIQLQRKNIHSTFCKFLDILNFHSTKLPVPSPIR